MGENSDLHVSNEGGLHSERSGVAASPETGRGGEGRERGQMTVDRMVEQVTPGITHTVGGGGDTKG